MGDENKAMLNIFKHLARYVVQLDGDLSCGIPK